MSGAQELHGHQEYIEWQGSRVLTLAPLWPQPLRAVVVGINPAPGSVAVGHYYQGRMGCHAMSKLAEVGVFPPPRADIWADDQAVAQGIGFTDLVRRPTVTAKDLSAAERQAGVVHLRAEIQERRPQLILAVFAPPVRALLGRGFGRPGRQVDTFEGIPVFKLPAMTTRRDVAAQAWADLATLWRDMFPDLAERDTP